MNVSLALVVVSASLVGCGVYLLLERSLTRVLVGIVLFSNGVNVLYLIASGAAGKAPLVGLNDPAEMSDPLPQAMVLTAIVITLGVSAFVLAMAYRSWQINGTDDVQDDVEDAAIRRLAELDAASQSYDENTGSVIETSDGDDAVLTDDDAGDPGNERAADTEHGTAGISDDTVTDSRDHR